MRLGWLISFVSLIAVMPALAEDSSDAWPEKAVSARARYEKELGESGATFQKSLEAIRRESERKTSAAKTQYDAAVKKSRDAYVSLLKSVQKEEARADRKASSAVLEQVIEYLVNGPPRNEIQKLWLASFEAEASGDFDRAIESARKAIDAAGQTPSMFAQLRLGWLYYLKKDYDKAEDAYRRAAKSSPRALTPWQGLMNCHGARNRLDDAAVVAREVLKLSPTDYQANKTLGDVYYGKKDYRRAASYYGKLAVAHPDDFGMATSLAWCHLNLGEKETAQRMFRDVLAVQPDNASALAGLVAIDKAEGDRQSRATGKILLRNLPSNVDTVSYLLDDQRAFSLEPGGSQTVDAEQSREIRFSRGPARGEAYYLLEPGNYEFRKADGRWELLHRVSD